MTAAEAFAGISIPGNGNLRPETFGRIRLQLAPETADWRPQTEIVRAKRRKCRAIPDATKLRQFGATGWWSKGDSNCEPLSDAFVNFSPFEDRGDANGDRPERADTLRSTGTTTDSYAPVRSKAVR